MSSAELTGELPGAFSSVDTVSAGLPNVNDEVPATPRARSFHQFDRVACGIFDVDLLPADASDDVVAEVAAGQQVAAPVGIVPH